jgi:cell division protein FtsX
MNSRQDLEAELNSVADRIGNARDALSRNEIVEMSDIPERMRTVADAITDLPPEEAVELRPALSDLLTDFKGFAEELKVKIGEIEAAGGSVGVQSGG